MKEKSFFLYLLYVDVLEAGNLSGILIKFNELDESKSFLM